MLNKNEIQGGDESTNIQHSQNVTVNNTHNYGLTYTDAKEIALDVFKTNFYQLSKEAASIAKQRAEEITDKFLNELKEQLPDGISQMNQPDIQYALFTVQKEYARTGDKELLENLVNILVDRVAANERSLLQIVLNESLDVLPKLTNEQLDILSLVFLLRYSRRLNISNIEDFKNYLLESIIPFMVDAKEESNYQHLEFTGCGSVSVLGHKIEDNFADSYKGLFSKGFSMEEFKSVLKDEKLSTTVLSPCLHNENLFQVSSVDDAQLEKICVDAGADRNLVEGIKKLQNSKIMTSKEVKDFVIGLDPLIKQLFEIWEESPLRMVTLTSVGIAIAQANIKRKISEQYNLSIWI